VHARALDLPLTASEAGAGLVPPAAAVFLLGKFGAILIVIMLFMAVTSSGSAELIAVSSLFTYDVYRTCESSGPSRISASVGSAPLLD
jgi:urea-proton symporter